MQVNESRSVRVMAGIRWNDTGIDLHRGQTYRLKATGEWCDWKYTSGPEGYPSRNTVQRLTTWARRERPADWFKLVGAIGQRRSTQFVIGCGREYQPRRDGRLFCFANDVQIAYFNNCGYIELTVTRPA
jgi:hypothetical protein